MLFSKVSEMIYLVKIDIDDRQIADDRQTDRNGRFVVLYILYGILKFYNYVCGIRFCLLLVAYYLDCVSYVDNWTY